MLQALEIMLSGSILVDREGVELEARFKNGLSLAHIMPDKD